MGRLVFLAVVVSVSAFAQVPPPVPYGLIQEKSFSIAPRPRVGVGQFNPDGVADLYTGNVFIPLPASFAVVLLNEDTSYYAEPRVPPTIPNSKIPLTVSVAAGDFTRAKDGSKVDRLEDVLLFDSRGRIILFENGGPSYWRQTKSLFRPPVLVDDFSARVPLTGSLPAYLLGVFDLLDLDGDGHLDLVIGGQVFDIWTSLSRTTGLHIYFGDGHGRFGVSAGPSPDYLSVSLAGSPVDYEWVDFDGNGQKETLTLLTDDANFSNYTVAIETLRFNGRALGAQSAQQLPVAGRAVGMEVAPLDGDGVPDYLFSMFDGYGQNQNAKLVQVAGLTNGKFNIAQITSYVLPPANLPNELIGPKVYDANQDGLLDIVGVHNLGIAANARLVYFQGKGAGQFHPVSTLELGNPTSLFNRSMWAINATPLRTERRQIEIADFNLDQAPDLIIGGVRLANQNGAQGALVLLNEVARLNSNYSKTKVERIGQGSTGSGEFRPRVGTWGGAPYTGNSRFEITLSNAKGSVPAAFHVGAVRFPFTVFKELHFETFSLRQSLFYRTNGVGPGEGSVLGAPVPIPNDPSMHGAEAFIFWALPDKSARRSVPVSLSDTVKITLGRQN